MGVKVHRNLVWLRADEQRLDLVVADPTLRKHVVARPAPELAAFLPKARTLVLKRLEQLGQAPREVST